MTKKKEREGPVRILLFNTTVPEKEIENNPTYGVNGAIHKKLAKLSGREISYAVFGGSLGGAHEVNFVRYAVKESDIVIIGDLNMDPAHTSLCVVSAKESIDGISQKIRAKNPNVKIFIKEAPTKKPEDKASYSFTEPTIQSYEDKDLIALIKKH